MIVQRVAIRIEIGSVPSGLDDDVWWQMLIWNVFDGYITDLQKRMLNSYLHQQVMNQGI